MTVPVPQTFGGQTLLVVNFTDNGPPDTLGMRGPAENKTVVPGCRHRPLSAKEIAEYGINVGTMVWNSTVPPVPAVLAMTVDSEIREGDATFKVIAGPQHHTDMDGSPFKVTVLSQRQVS
ncbi:Gp9 [Mycolicibacterium canariasense]|uniref:Gp9 n=1 Tax=Mycolicibacterium canariasense TaxID=228230 RepID=A0A117IAS5_MYCCR|nr:hypothetical protein [Mycolicibacterium canariasense]GAS96800.1 Gp9 [Mycolicibacterium canariasense]